MTAPDNPQIDDPCPRCENQLKQDENLAWLYTCPYCDTHCLKCNAEIRSIGLGVGFCDCQRWQWQLLKGENPESKGYWALEPESALGKAASEAYDAAYEVLAAALERKAAGAMAASICAAPQVQVMLEMGHYDLGVANARNAAETFVATLIRADC